MIKFLKNEINIDTLYTESTMRYVLDLLCSTIDSNALNQGFILSLGIGETITNIISQNEWFDVAGKGCLFLSHLVWKNNKAR
jgi:hypothetical protein